MTVSERAMQLWSLLAHAATNRQVLTYDLVSQLVGVPRQGLGKLLEPIQSYCLVKNLPPLTVLVVQKESGLPGPGFIAAEQIPGTQMRVFEFDWKSHGCPAAEAFDEAVRQRPSDGVR